MFIKKNVKRIAILNKVAIYIISYHWDIVLTRLRKKKIIVVPHYLISIIVVGYNSYCI